ncbi:hypothetical protein F5Y03DRAFT_375924 [Xylaria venustula]|nr:hypothetical protein F5Y03DRAFT_375924 [Xylaria venustula]
MTTSLMKIGSLHELGGWGLLLDLDLLNAVELSSGGTFASLGPGARWGDVYVTPYPQGVVGTRVHHRRRRTSSRRRYVTCYEPGWSGRRQKMSSPVLRSI